MEDKKVNGKDQGLVCSCCSHYGGGWWGANRWLRILIGVIVALVIFWVGMKVGEFRDRFAGFGFNRGGSMMMRGGGYGAGGYGGMRSPTGMRGFDGGAPGMMNASGTASTTLR